MIGILIQGTDVAEKNVPEGVFGSLKRALETPGDQGKDEGESTLERMKKARQ